MSSLLSLVSEFLPMIMPASTEVVRATEMEPSNRAIEGPVVERPAMINKCDKMCTSVMTIKPSFSSTIRHNSEQDTIVHTVSGSGVLIVNEGLDMKLKRHELSAGDSVFIPAWTEHQFQNTTEEDVVLLLVQSGPSPVGADLADWGGAETNTRT